ncbi:MAG: hypothetical protein ACLQAH_17105 [Limisphaerales bacterium]
MKATASLPTQRWIVAELDALQAEVDALKELQRQTGEELDALLPAILQSSPGFRLRIASPRQVDPAGDRAFIRLPSVSARQAGQPA